MLTAVLRGGKRQFGGKIAYAGCIRSEQALLCAHGGLARHLIMTFTINGAPFPDPAATDVWRNSPLWPGNNPQKSISYAQHLEAVTTYLADMDIVIAKKTHAFRMYKARDLDEQGVDDAVRSCTINL